MPNLEEYTGEIVPLQEYTGEVISDTSPEKTSQKLRGGFGSQVSAALSGENYQSVEVPTTQKLGKEYSALGTGLKTSLAEPVLWTGSFVSDDAERARQNVERQYKESKKEFPRETMIGYGLGEAAKSVPEGVIIGKGLSLAGRGISKLVGMRKSAEELADAVAVARRQGQKLIDKATTVSEKEAAKAEAERLVRETLIKRQAAQNIPAEQQEIEKLSRSESKILPVSDPQALNAEIRQAAKESFGNAEKLQQEVGGEAFNKYNKAVSELEKTNPLHLSEVGQELKSVLDDGISGGVRGGLRTVDEQQSKILEKIRDAIFGKPKKVPSAAEIEIEAAKQPSSFSDVMKRQKAKEILMAKQEEAPPYNAKLVDDLLRELRQTEQSKLPEAGTMVARGRYGSSADLIEQALEKWVGEDIYPRQIYREASEPFNRFSTKLGEALKAQEEIPYSKEPGKYLTAQKQLSDLLFGNQENTSFAKKLLGSSKVDFMAEKYVANELEGKTSGEVKEWIKKNDFFKSIPKLEEKIKTYASKLAEREAAAERMGILQKQYGKDIERVKKTAADVKKETEAVKSTLDDLRIKMADLPPEKIVDEWAKTGGLRKKLEDTGKFTSQELDNLGTEISNLSKTADKVARRQKINDFMNSILKKALIGIGGYEAAKIGYNAYQTFTGD